MGSRNAKGEVTEQLVKMFVCPKPLPSRRLQTKNIVMTALVEAPGVSAEFAMSCLSAPGTLYLTLRLGSNGLESIFRSSTDSSTKDQERKLKWNQPYSKLDQGLTHFGAQFNHFMTQRITKLGEIFGELNFRFDTDEPEHTYQEIVKAFLGWPQAIPWKGLMNWKMTQIQNSAPPSKKKKKNQSLANSGATETNDQKETVASPRATEDKETPRDIKSEPAPMITFKEFEKKEEKDLLDIFDKPLVASEPSTSPTFSTIKFERKNFRPAAGRFVVKSDDVDIDFNKPLPPAPKLETDSVSIDDDLFGFDLKSASTPVNGPPLLNLKKVGSASPLIFSGNSSHSQLPCLRDFLEIQPGFLCFLELLEQERNVENLNFYRTVEIFRLFPEGDFQTDTATNIWTTFLEKNAPYWLNTPAFLYFPTKERIEKKSIDATMFDLIQDEILKLMEMNSWVNFKSSPLLEKYFQMVNNNTNNQ